MYKISPTIDTKVCNKKVAVDDVGPIVVTKRDMPQPATQRDVQHQPWSCIDYVDTEHEGDEAPTEERRATKPAGGDGLRMRFGSMTGHGGPQEDHEGECKKRDTDAWGREKACNAARELILDGGETEAEHKWWTGKQTNHGWPGTAEGKINTAQGMAGDLVSNLDSEEKSAVVRICGGVVCELRW